MSTGVSFVIVRHDPWCPMAYGEGSACAPGCRAVASTVDEASFKATMTRDMRNRAQRRADAQRARRAGDAR